MTPQLALEVLRYLSERSSGDRAALFDQAAAVVYREPRSEWAIVPALDDLSSSRRPHAMRRLLEFGDAPRALVRLLVEHCDRLRTNDRVAFLIQTVSGPHYRGEVREAVRLDPTSERARANLDAALRPR